MGNVCGIDIFEELMARYGDDFVKFIVGQKSKEMVDKKTEEGKKEVSKQIGDYKKQVLGEIKNEESKLDGEIKKYKGQLPDALPAALGSPEELLGVNAIKGQFDTMRKQVDNKFGMFEKEAHEDMGKVQKASCEEITKNQPEIPLYGSLPQKEKNMILERGEKQFGPQIKKAGKEQEDALLKKLDPSAYLDKVKNVVPMDSISGITNNATSKFQSAVKMASGGGIPGIGSFF